MKKTLVLICGLFLVGCGTYQPIRGTYPLHPTSRHIDKPFSDVWTNLIAFITTTGIRIQTIEKASGLMVSGDYSFEGTVTHEYAPGKLKDTKDWIVCSFLGNPDAVTPTGIKQNSNFIAPKEVTGSFNVHVVEDSKSGTRVTINIVNLKAIGPNGYYAAKSTGMFEKMLLDELDK